MSLTVQTVDWQRNTRDSAPEGAVLFRVHETSKSSGKEKVAFVSFKTIGEAVACFAGEEGAANKSELSIHEVHNPFNSKGVKLFVDVEKTQSNNYTHADIETFAKLISGILSTSYNRATGKDPEMVTIYSSSCDNKLSLHGVVTGSRVFASTDDIGRVVGSGIVAYEKIFPGTIERLVWYDSRTGTHKFAIDFKCTDSLRALYSTTREGKRRKTVFMRNLCLVSPQQPVSDADVRTYLPESFVFAPDQGEVLSGLPDVVAVDSMRLVSTLRTRESSIVIAYPNTHALTPATATINRSIARNNGDFSAGVVQELLEVDALESGVNGEFSQLLRRIGNLVLKHHCMEHPAFGANSSLKEGESGLRLYSFKVILPGDSFRCALSHGWALRFQCETNSRYCERRPCQKNDEKLGSVHATRTLGFDINVAQGGPYLYRTMCPSTNHGVCDDSTHTRQVKRMRTGRSTEDSTVLVSRSKWRPLNENAEMYIYMYLCRYHNNGRGRVI